VLCPLPDRWIHAAYCEAVLRAIGNVLWFLLAGIWLAIGYAIVGVVMCITIIGIPFGIRAFKLAAFTPVAVR
jgi:uncharacterized membrane protein YccF (DUF307 family)